MYLVIIEWDGEPPSMTFYNRMHGLGLFVRGDKEKSPLERRAVADGSVIAQEGAIMCVSPSLARAIAAYAREEGASLIKIGTLDVEDYYMTTEDAKVMNRVEKILGRRGRPSGQPVDWIVTCLEEAKSYMAYDMRKVVNCPHCHGLMIRTRHNQVIPAYKFPAGDVFEAWIRHRLHTGQFEKAREGDDYPEPPKKVEIDNADEARTLEIMGNSQDLMQAVKRLPQEAAARILDGVLMARAHLPYDVIRDGRVKATIRLFEKEVSASDVRMYVQDDEYDMLDAASVIGAEHVASLWLSLRKKGAAS